MTVDDPLETPPGEEGDDQAAADGELTTLERNAIAELEKELEAEEEAGA